MRNTAIIIAFRGTAQAIDALPDLKLGAGMNTTYFSAGEEFAARYVRYGDVTVTGHSLGGAMAQVVANRRRLPMATFNAPGVGVVASRNILTATFAMSAVRSVGMLSSVVRHPVQAMRDISSALTYVRGVNICLQDDIVSQVGVHYGKVLRIRGTGTNPMTEHKIATVISVLSQARNAWLASSDPLTV